MGNAQTFLLVAGVMLMCFTLIRLARRKRRQQAAEPEPPIQPLAPMPPKAVESTPPPPPSRTAEARATDETEVRIYNTFRELSAELDTKILVLNELIEEADRKVAELKATSTAMSRPIVVPATPPEEEPMPPAAKFKQRPEFEEIYSLIDRGMTPGEVSQKLNRPLGEVNLILGLRRRRPAG